MTLISEKSCTLRPSVLQELQGADASAGREPAGLLRGPQGEAAEKERAQVEDHPGGRGSHRAGAAEQGADGAVAQGEAVADSSQHPDFSSSLVALSASRSSLCLPGDSGNQSQAT